MSSHILLAMTAVLFSLYYIISFFYLLLGWFINTRLTHLVCCERPGPIYVQDHTSGMLSLDQSCSFALLGLNPSKQCENLILNQHSAQIHAIGSPGAYFLPEVWWKSMSVVLAESGWNIYQNHLMGSAWIWGNEGLCDVRYVLRGFVFDCCVRPSRKNRIKKHWKNWDGGLIHFALNQIGFLIGSPTPIGLSSHNQQHVCSLSLARWWTEPQSRGVAWWREVCILVFVTFCPAGPSSPSYIYPVIHLHVCCGPMELKRHPGYSSWDLRLGVDWGRVMCMLSRLGIKKKKREEGNAIGQQNRRRT